MAETLTFHRGRLPHWLVADRTYFVTFSVKGAIPANALNQLRAGELCDGKAFLRMDDVLHAKRNALCVLHEERIAPLLLDAMEWLCAPVRGWMIYVACVMPSHVHMVLRNEGGRSDCLCADVAAYKNFTARRCNKVLQRSGAFWAQECFDHWCRTSESAWKSIVYTIRNPVRGHLVERPKDWPWMRIGEEYAAAVADLLEAKGSSPA